MTAPKYDRNTLKAMFFQSEILDVKGFFESIWHRHNTHIVKNTKGWTEEKKKFKEDLKNKALEQAEKEFIENYKPDAKELGKYHKILIWVIAKKLVSLAKKDTEAEDIFVSDIERLWKMIKTEKGEATTVNKNMDDGTLKITGDIEIELPT